MKIVNNLRMPIFTKQEKKQAGNLERELKHKIARKQMLSESQYH